MTKPDHYVAVGAPLERVVAAFLIFLGLGIWLNFATKYEWLLFRNTDLYSWAPAARHSYRCDYGRSSFVLPLEDPPLKMHHVMVEDLPGIQITKDREERVGALLAKQWNKNDELHQQLMRKLSGYQKEKNLPSLDDISLTRKKLHFAICVNQTEDPLDWSSWLVGTNIRRVNVRAYESWPDTWRANAELLSPVRLRDYWNSSVYWFLLALPILFLLFDVRLPFFSKSSREALFTTLPNPFILFIEWILAPFLCLSCIWSACKLFPSHPLLSILKQSHVFTICVVDALANGMDRNWKWLSKSKLSAIAFYTSLAIRTFAVLILTLATRDWESKRDKRFMSCQNACFTQLLAAIVLGHLFSKVLAVDDKSPTTTRLNDKAITSGFVKFVLSMTMYTAGATKLGEAGFGWIDDRYIAQLSLRGRYWGAPFPLESIMLWGPPSFRAMGMLTVLFMELLSIFSWWDYGRHYVAWLVFQIVSTLSIGVPIVLDALLGPMWPLVSVVLESLKQHPILWLGAVLGLAGVYRMAFLSWNPRFHLKIE